MVSSYVYVPLESSQIRLLVLQPGEFGDPLAGYLRISQFAEGEYPVYEALSYVWGDQENPELITILEEDLPQKGATSLAIGPSLASALYRLRQEHEPRTLWCDSICINQQDVDERSAQVSLMGDLYREASRVVVWLGLEQNDSTEAINVMEVTGSQVEINKATGRVDILSTADPKYREWDQELPYSQRQWLAVQRLFKRDWFKRLWTRQEIALANQHQSLVVVGSSMISWYRFIGAVGYIYVKYGRSPSIRSSIDFSRDISNVWNIQKTEPNTRGLLALLQFTKRCECSDNRDRVYALLGLLHPDQRRDLGFVPDYTLSVKDVYKSFARDYAKKGVVNILAYCDMATSPSWVPDLHTQPTFRLGDYTSEGPSVTGPIHLFDGDKVGVNGILHEKISSSKTVEDDCSGVHFKQRILEIMFDYLGHSSDDWHPSHISSFTSAVLGGSCFEYRNSNDYPTLEASIKVFRGWGKSEAGYGEVPLKEISPDEISLVRVLQRVLGGRSCLRLEDGSFAVGPRGCQSGDLVYVILGCGIPLALRRSSSIGHRVLGPCYYPGCAAGEALHGPLPTGWRLGFDDHTRPLFQDEHGAKHKKDPRLREVKLPLCWWEYEDEDGRAYWWKEGSAASTYQDPRLTPEMFKERGIKVEDLILT